jgi:hypothetical protein
MIRRVWDPTQEQWIESKDEPPANQNTKRELWKQAVQKTFDAARKLEQKGHTSEILHPQMKNVSLQAMAKANVAEWMAWKKFATIVQSVSNISAEIIATPEQQLPKSLSYFAIDPVSGYIPDHNDNWYQRQLETENAEIDRRKMISYNTGDRTPLEMLEMEKFLARKQYNGTVRGTHVVKLAKKLDEEGLQGFPNVTTFRDGSTMVGERRFTKDGTPFMQYSDGSYVLDGQQYDRN